MPDRRRRDLLLALGFLPILASTVRSAPATARLQPTVVREVDISGYDTMLLPREHGQLVPITRSLVRRYPSRDHCMQMAAFFNSRSGLLVIGNDPLAGIADWQVLPGNRLRVSFYGSAPELLIVRIEPTVSAAAIHYREWARQQSWCRTRRRTTRRLDFISVAAATPMSAERAHQDTVLSSVDGALGVWFTQWRRYPFDRMYPDYTAREPAEFAGLLSRLHARKVLTFPYINGLLWDAGHMEFQTIGNSVALRGETLGQSSYNRALSFLRYACPHTRAWRDCLIGARNAIRDLDGRPSSGIYFDMVAAANPQLCWAIDHDHEPGDPYAWQQGIRALLAATEGAVMVEGCAEIYLDQVDYLLMHLHTDQPDMVPLWQAVYGDHPQPVGWKLTAGATAEQVAQTVLRAREFGALPTPWMTPEPEAELFRRGVFGNRPNSPTLREKWQ